MNEREYSKRMLKDLQGLKKQVLCFDAKKRKEFGYFSLDLPKPISHIGITQINLYHLIQEMNVWDGSLVQSVDQRMTNEIS